MVIAVTYQNGDVFQHFGKTQEFKIYTCDGSSVTESKVVGTEGKGHGELVGFIKDKKAEVLICGGLGGPAKSSLEEAGIKVYGGVQGNADQAVQDFLQGKLSYNPDVHCDHHHDHEEGGEHNCHSGKC